MNQTKWVHDDKGKIKIQLRFALIISYPSARLVE